MTRRILIVEDNEQNIYMMTYLLKHAGFEILQARDGETGIRIASMRRRCPDLVILDIQLPSMDGYAVARALRAIDGFSAVPIVAVTSYAMPGDRERILAAGCSAYLEKPIDPDTFVTSIREHLPIVSNPEN